MIALFVPFVLLTLLGFLVKIARAEKTASIRHQAVVTRRRPHPHPKWTCFITQKFHKDFILNEHIIKEIRLIQGMKHLVVHISRDFPLKGGLLNRDINIQGNTVHCIDVEYDLSSRRATPYLIIDDMREEYGGHFERIDIAYRIAIAYERQSE